MNIDLALILILKCTKVYGTKFNDKFCIVVSQLNVVTQTQQHNSDINETCQNFEYKSSN